MEKEQPVQNEPTTVLHEKHTPQNGPGEPSEGGLNKRAPRHRRSLAEAMEVERRRIGEILRADPDYKVSELIHHLAFRTDTPVEVALGIIAKVKGENY